jgi:phage terminase large subunit
LNIQLNTTVIFKKNLEQINSHKNVIVNEGGQHSSKTYSILQLILFLSRTTKNKLYTVVAESIPFLKVGAMRQFLEILINDEIYEEDKWNATDRSYKMGSNIIEFKAYDTPTKALGAKRDFLFINEAINIPYETYQNLEGRTNVLTFLDYNPSFEFWVHEKLLSQPNVGFVHSTYKDNPYIPKKIIDTIESYKTYDPNRWRVMGEGLIGSNEGLVFQNWSITDEFPESDKIVYGMDFGFTNDPSTCIGVFKQNGELYIDEIFYNLGMTNADIANALESNGLRKGYSEIYADSAEPKSIDELHRRGWNVKPSVKGPDSVQKGIDNIKQYRMNVSKRSVNLIKELRQYMWIKDINGNLTNKPGGRDHAIDALRYGLSSLERRRVSGFTVI